MLHRHNILSGVWFLEQGFAADYLPIVASYLSTNAKLDVKPRNALKETDITADNGCLFAVQSKTYTISDYGDYSSPEDAPKNSVAIIGITGAITKHDQNCGPSGMQTKANLLQRCFSNSNINAVILKIDSGGGEGLACRLFQDAISQKNKPVLAFCDDTVASAAYGIAASCDKIVANSEMCRVGSIGTYITIADYSAYYKNMGVDLKQIYATKSTDKNQDYIQALEGNMQPLLDVCDRYNEDFISRIANFRGDSINQDQSTWGTGKMFFAPEALELGLIDAVDSFENVLNYFNT